MSELNLNEIKKNIANRINSNAQANLHLEEQKNFNRVNALMAITCSEKCLKNFKSTSLSIEENECLGTCANLFYDSLLIGNGIYEKSNK